MMNFEVYLNRSESKFILSNFDEKAKKLLSEIAEASGTGDIEATVLKAAQLNVVNNFGLAISRVIAEKDAELKDQFQQLQPEPKAEQKPAEKTRVIVQGKDNDIFIDEFVEGDFYWDPYYPVVAWAELPRPYEEKEI